MQNTKIELTQLEIRTQEAIVIANSLSLGSVAQAAATRSLNEKLNDIATLVSDLKAAKKPSITSRNKSIPATNNWRNSDLDPSPFSNQSSHLTLNPSISRRVSLSGFDTSQQPILRDIMVHIDFVAPMVASQFANKTTTFFAAGLAIDIRYAEAYKEAESRAPQGEEVTRIIAVWKPKQEFD